MPTDSLVSAWSEGYGLDLGDGESAIAWVRMDRLTEPHILEIRGQKRLITAVAEHPKRGLLISEEAYEATGESALYVRFKARYLPERDAAEGKLRLFARGLWNALVADGRMLDSERACFYVGCPSGWTQTERDEYARLFTDLGYPNVQVVPESRAAFLYARESGELRIAQESLGQSTLIVDAGSSTTDFTHVVNLVEQPFAAHDFGHTALGGGLIDRLLWEKNLARSPHQEALTALIARHPAYGARCELEARRVKEMYFTQEARGGEEACESSFKIYYEQPPWTVDVHCDRADMAEILARPLAELGGRSIGAAFQQAVEGAKAGMAGAPPQTVLLTGGASRMGFLQQMIQETFPEALLVRGAEPEFAIARGLAYACRLDQRTRGFFSEIEALIASEDFEDAILSALPELFEGIAMPIAAALADEIAPEVCLRWQRGEIATLQDMADTMTREALTFVKSDEMLERLRPATLAWLKALGPRMEALTDPLCDAYGIPRASLTLPALLTLSGLSVSYKPGDWMGMSGVEVLLDLVLASLIAPLLGGSGVALLLEGIAGIAAGVVLSLILLLAGRKVVERMLMSMVIPQKMRGLLSMNRFRKSLETKKGKMAASIRSQLMAELDPPSDTVRQMVNGMAGTLEEQLRVAAERAVLLIH